MPIFSERKEKKILTTFLLGILAGSLIFFGVFGTIIFSSKNKSLENPTGLKSAGVAIVNPAEAKEIYPLFLCPCCGQPLAKDNICCGLAQERINYIDSLVAQNLSEKEIILAYIKKYGLNSFVDKNKAAAMKEELAKIAPANRPIISIAPDFYDFKEVSQKKGIISTFFEIKNEGKSELVIDNLGTSCGCTYAAIVYQGAEGPKFAMPGHGIENPTDWRLAIPPGGSAQLKVYYDPSVHRDFRGFAVREIYLYSNDPVDFEKKVKIELFQVD